MATTTLMKTEEKTGNWSAVFPNETKSAAQSALFVKKLLAVAVSNIAYLRVLFPEAAFSDKSLEGVNLKILKDDKACQGAVKIIRWMHGCFDALDKKYLRAMMLGLYLDPENPDTVVECYTFKFSYADEGGMDIYRNNEKIYGSKQTEPEIRKSTIMLLRNIILLTQNLGTVPDEARLTMKLLYYDDVTPEDYEPPGFQSGDYDDFDFEGKSMTIKVGDVNTLHHGLKVRMTTEKEQFRMMKQDNVEEAESQQTQISDGLDQPDTYTDSNNKENQRPLLGSGKARSRLDKLKEPLANADVPAESPAKPVENAVDQVESEASQHTDIGEEFKVRCPCGCNEDDGLMVSCEECNFWQHGVCFLVLEEQQAPEHHVCDLCAQMCGRKCTDPSLGELSQVQVQATCLWRRALLACLDLHRVVAPTLATRLGTEVPVAQGLINRLSKEGFLKPPGKAKKLGRVVDTKKVQEDGISKYLKPKGQMDSAEQIENTDARHSQPDHSQNATETHQEIDKLTEEAKNLAINNPKTNNNAKTNKLSRSKKDHNQKAKVSDGKDNSLEEDAPSCRSGRKRGLKRLYSERDDVELEVSNTQDVYVAEPSLKRKSSVPKDQMT